MTHQYNLRKTRNPVNRLIENMNQEVEETLYNLNEPIANPMHNINSNGSTNDETELSRPISPQNDQNFATMINQIQELKTSLENQMQALENRIVETIETQNHNMQNYVENQIKALEIEVKNNTMKIINNLELKLLDKIAHTKNEFNENLLEINDKLTKQDNFYKKELKEIELKIKQIEHKQTDEMIYQPMDLYRDLRNTNSLPWDNNMPKFSTKNINPMEFINNMEDFINRTKLRRRKDGNLYLSDLHGLISNMLEGTANQWWQVVKSDIESLDEFKERFLEKYWNDEIQSEIKRKLENGKYTVGGRLTRTEYFIEKVLIMKNLTPRLTETEIIKQLSNHYDKLIKDAVKVQKIRLIKDMENLLNQEDLDDRTRPNTYNTGRKHDYDRRNDNSDRYRVNDHRSRNNEYNYHENEHHYRHENHPRRQNYNYNQRDRNNGDNTQSRQNPKN